MKTKKWDPLICLVLSIVLLIFVSQLSKTKPMARVYPTVIIVFSYLMIALTMINWFINRKKEKENEDVSISNKRLIYIFLYALAILVYILLMNRIGYIPMTIIFGIYSLIFLQCKNKVVIFVLPVVVTFLMYFIFSHFLFVTLPPGILRGIL